MKPSGKADGYSVRSISHHSLRTSLSDTPTARSVSLLTNPRKKKLLDFSYHFKNVFKSRRSNNNTTKQIGKQYLNINSTVASTEEDTISSKNTVYDVDDNLPNNNALMKLIQNKLHQNEMNRMVNHHHPNEINMMNGVTNRDRENSAPEEFLHCYDAQKTEHKNTSTDALRILAQENKRMKTENIELYRNNELLITKQANLELILKEKERIEQERPKLRKKYKKLQHNYNIIKSKVTSIEEIVEKCREDNSQLIKAKLKVEEMNETMAQENESLKIQLMTLNEGKPTSTWHIASLFKSGSI